MKLKKEKDAKKEVVSTNIRDMTEDQIISEGLKHNTKKDIMCYVGMVILFFMIFVPPIFRVAFYDPSQEVREVTVVYITMECRKSFIRDGTTIINTIKNEYKDSVLQTSVMSYELKNNKEGEVIAEINELDAIDSPLIKKEVSGNTYTYTLDYTKPDLRNVEYLKGHGEVVVAQLQKYRADRYTCETYKEEVIEERRGDEVDY